MRLAFARSKKHPHSVVFQDAGWRFYKAMLREFDEQPSRINYDRGRLEVMTLSIERERIKSVVGEMIGLIATLLRLRMARGGSSTLKRFSKHRGLEADHWVANERIVRTKKRLNLTADPPHAFIARIGVDDETSILADFADWVRTLRP